MNRCFFLGESIHDALDLFYDESVVNQPGLVSFVMKQEFSTPNNMLGPMLRNRVKAIADGVITPGKIEVAPIIEGQAITEFADNRQGIMSYIANKNYAGVELPMESEVAQNFFSTLLVQGYAEKKIEKFLGKIIFPIEVNIPSIEKTIDKFTFKILEKTDPLGAILGNLTGCCQKIGGEAENCVYDGFNSPDAGFLAVFDNKEKVIAQSWIRLGPPRAEEENKRVLYLDNIETTGNYGNHTDLKSAYIQFAEWIKKQRDYANVVAGEGYSDMKFPGRKRRALTKKTLEFPNSKKGIYTDLKDTNPILAKSINWYRTAQTEDDICNRLGDFIPPEYIDFISSIGCLKPRTLPTVALFNDLISGSTFGIPIGELSKERVVEAFEKKRNEEELAKQNRDAKLNHINWYKIASYQNNEENQIKPYEEFTEEEKKIDWCERHEVETIEKDGIIKAILFHGTRSWPKIKEAGYLYSGSLFETYPQSAANYGHANYSNDKRKKLVVLKMEIDINLLSFGVWAEAISEISVEGNLLEVIPAEKNWYKISQKQPWEITRNEAFNSVSKGGDILWHGVRSKGDADAILSGGFLFSGDETTLTPNSISFFDDKSPAAQFGSRVVGFKLPEGVKFLDLRDDSAMHEFFVWRDQNNRTGRAETLENLQDFGSYDGVIDTANGGTEYRIYNMDVLRMGTVFSPSHKLTIEEALRQGKPISEEVLKDYPELIEEAKVKKGYRTAQTKSDSNEASKTTYNDRLLNKEVKLEDLVELHRLEYMIRMLERRNYVENNVALLKMKDEFFRLSDLVLKTIAEGFNEWIEAHTEKGWIREHDEELLYGKGNVGGDQSFYRIDITEDLMDKVLERFISNPGTFHNIYDKEGMYSFYQIFETVIVDNLIENESFLNSEYGKNLLNSFLKELNLESEYQEYMEDVIEENDVYQISQQKIEFIREHLEDFINFINIEEIIENFGSEISLEDIVSENLIPENWFDALVFPREEIENISYFRDIDSIIENSKEIGGENAVELSKANMRFQEEEFIDNNKGPLYDDFMEIAKVVGFHQFNDSIDLSTKDFNHMEKVIYDIREAKNRILDSLSDYDLNKRSIALTLALNAIHVSGNMMEYLGLYKSDLDYLSNIDIGEWDDQLKRISIKKDWYKQSELKNEKQKIKTQSNEGFSDLKLENSLTASEEFKKRIKAIKGDYHV